MEGMLSLDRAPPFSAPLRFFLTAPLFLLLAGLLLLAVGDEIFVSRWTPAALALTHLVTVGFMLLTMLGALIQVLPVVAGANLERPLLVARLVHGGLSLGVLLLSAAFLSAEAELYLVASATLGVAALLFFFAAAKALLPLPSTSPTIRGLKLSLLGGVGVVALGVCLAIALAQGWALPLIDLANVHATWGFAAWGAVLLAAMAYVVVPMFQLTPGYRARVSWVWPPLMLGLVLLLSLGVFLEQPQLSRLGEGLLALLGASFVIYTLRLQSQRRRARVDAPYLYWKWGLWSALVALAMSLLAALLPELAEWPGWALLFGVLLGLGGFVSLIIGMLYRIVPFLVWLHLQEQGRAPNVGKILPEQHMRRQMQAHFLAVLLCLGAVFFPEWLARPAGLMLAIAAGWLFLNLLAAARVYQRLLPGEQH